MKLRCADGLKVFHNLPMVVQNGAQYVSHSSIWPRIAKYDEVRRDRSESRLSLAADVALSHEPAVMHSRTACIRGRDSLALRSRKSAMSASWK